MANKSAYAKLRSLIRKMVQEELSKTLKSNDPRHDSSRSDNFDLDPRFSTGHYTMRREPFPHFSEEEGYERHSGKGTDNMTSGYNAPEFREGFNHPPFPPQPPSGQRKDAWPDERGFPPPFPPPDPGFSGPPAKSGKQRKKSD